MSLDFQQEMNCFAEAHFFISIYPDSELIDKFAADSLLSEINGKISRAIFPFHKLVESGDPLKTASDFFQKIYVEIAAKF